MSKANLRTEMLRNIRNVIRNGCICFIPRNKNRRVSVTPVRMIINLVHIFWKIFQLKTSKMGKNTWPDNKVWHKRTIMTMSSSCGSSYLSPSTGLRCETPWSGALPLSRPCSGNTKPTRGSTQNQRPWILVWQLRSPAGGKKHINRPEMLGNILWKCAFFSLVYESIVLWWWRCYRCSVKTHYMHAYKHLKTKLKHSVHTLESEELWLLHYPYYNTA